MRLSLCMIVRNNAGIIEESLSSISPWVDEMVVVDTGSLDQTPEIAARLGARVFNFAWIDDFSAARNESLRHARGEWVFWMDSDDVIDHASGERLRRLADSQHPNDVLGYVMQVHCPGAGGVNSGDVTIVDHVKMFRNREDLRFEGRIHEQILPSIRNAGGEVEWTEIHVTHKYGAVTQSDRSHKHERDLRILHAELVEKPNHPFVLFNLGMTYADMEEPRIASQYLEKSIEVAGPNESHLSKAYALLAATYLQMNELAKAGKVTQDASKQFPDDPEVLFRSALTQQQLGNHQTAIELYTELLETPQNSRNRRFSSRDVGIAGHKARHNYAILLSELGRWIEAELQWRLAIEEIPQFRAAALGLCEALVAQKKYVTAKELSERWQHTKGLVWIGLFLQAKTLEDDPSAAIQCLKKACEISPDAAEALEELAKLEFQQNLMEDARTTLSRLRIISPLDPRVLHNLGSVLLALGETEAAIEELEQSLRIRPDAPSTESLLLQARSSLEHANHPKR